MEKSFRKLLVKGFQIVVRSEFVSKLVFEKTRFVNTHNLPKWLDDEVKVNIKFRNQLKQTGDWEGYKKQRSYVTNMTRQKSYF